MSLTELCFESGKILVAVIFISAIANAVAYFSVLRRHYIKWIAAGLALFATLITWWQLQDHSVLFDAEGAVLNKIKKVENVFLPVNKSVEFIDNNFILINTSADPCLIPASGSTYKQVVDRQKLTKLLDFLTDQKERIDMVVCDLVFPDNTPYDNSLNKAFKKLSINNKLILGYNRSFFPAQNMVYSNLPKSVFGEIGFKDEKGIYFTHRLMNNEGMPSLPYLLYLKLSGIQATYGSNDFFIKERANNKPPYYVFPGYISEMYFTDESRLYEDSIANTYREAVDANSSSRIIASGIPFVYDLGMSTTPAGQLQITDLLDSKKPFSKSIVFIGSFQDEYIDVHPTFYGSLHGTSILLNEFYHIQNKHHRMSVAQLIAYFFSLFTGYLAILFYLLNHMYARQQKVRATSASPDHRWEYVKTLLEFLFNELHFVLLFIFGMAIDILWHKTINILGLVYYFLVFRAFLNIYFKRYLSKE